MADITMCRDDRCPHRQDCYRYLAPASENQAWFAELVRDGDDCRYFWPMEPR